MDESAGSVRHEELRVRNRGMMVAALRQARRLSRTELARSTNLSHSTVSAISADLISEGVVRLGQQSSNTAARRGRPQVALELAPALGLVVTGVLSLNRFSAAVADYAGSIVAEQALQLQTTSIDRDGLIKAIEQSIAALLDKQPADAPLLRITIAVQGVTDAAARTLLWSPITPHHDIRLADVLEDRFGIPVAVENDCSMLAVSLRGRDPATYRNNFLTVLLSHGIGMGLVLRGEVFTGTRSSAGEFGHMIHVPDGALCRCGRRGCIEAYAGNYAIWRRARNLSPDAMPKDTIDDGDMTALIAAARAHRNGPERRAFAEAGRAIGFGLGSLFALIDPVPVALVGVGASAFDLLEEPIRTAINQTAGGQHSDTVTFALEPNEMPLIRDGCALHALSAIDSEMVAPGFSVPPQAARSA